MCAGSTAGAFASGLAEVRAGRRALLKAGGAGLLFSAAVMGAGGSAAAAPRARLRAYVLVVDGCRPDEIDSGLMPHLRELRDGGLRYPDARSMPVAETIPNHVMMMAGVRPDRSGVPANSVFDRAVGEVRTMDRPSDIRVPTVIERLNGAGYRTGTVLSKEYLYGVFGERATYRWEPAPVVPASGHAPDAFTMDAALSMLEELDPHLMFVNLGDVDRMGHTDETGTLGLRAARQAALVSTDQQVGRFVSALESSGRWADSIVIVLADHSMDWSLPAGVVSLAGPLAEDPFLAGHVEIAQNGGADLLYWTGPEPDRPTAVARMREVALAQPGVLSAHDPAELSLGPEAGDLVVYCRAGWRFSDPDPVLANPIPGNHGHPASHAIPFFVGGGHPAVPRGLALSARASTIDVAPTLSAFFKVGGPAGGYDGRNRLP